MDILTEVAQLVEIKETSEGVDPVVLMEALKVTEDQFTEAVSGEELIERYRAEGLL